MRGSCPPAIRGVRLPAMLLHSSMRGDMLPVCARAACIRRAILAGSSSSSDGLNSHDDALQSGSRLVSGKRGHQRMHMSKTLRWP